MPRLTTQLQSAAALANATAFAAVVPGAAANCKLTAIELGVGNAGGAITDMDIVVGLNRGTARGTASTTLTGQRVDPNSGGSQITGVDTAWSVAPTLAAADGWLWGFNSRSTLVLLLDELRIISNVGLANPLVFLNRTGLALPTAHYLTLTLEWFE